MKAARNVVEVEMKAAKIAYANAAREALERH